MVGAATALFAATVAVAQRDIKRVLAYSTISQLGYMFLAVGVGAYVAAIFHMVTHAFFKALLFLGAGSVIHGMHDEQDMRRMGALREFMPVTAATFIVGWLAIAGVPPFAGFWSKDEILAVRLGRSNQVLWAVGAVTALLTAFYMTRQVFLVFFGEPRWQEEADDRRAEEALATPEHEPAAATAASGDEAAHHEGEPHESPWTHAHPPGGAGRPVDRGRGPQPPGTGVLTLEHWLEPVLEGSIHELEVAAWLQVALAVTSTSAPCSASLAARRSTCATGCRPSASSPRSSSTAWYVDEALVAAWSTAPVEAVAEGAATCRPRGIDGAVNGVATLVRGGGARLRVVQTGYVRNYALGIAVGAVLLLGFFVDPGRGSESAMDDVLPDPHRRWSSSRRVGALLVALRAPEPRPELARLVGVATVGGRRRAVAIYRARPSSTDGRRAASSSSPATPGSTPSASPGTSGSTASRCSWSC